MASDPNLLESSVRASADGVAYICPGTLVRGIDPDFNLVRPSIRVPDAFDIFQRVLAYSGYDCEISDKGRYESETVAKLGGIELAGGTFRNSKLRALLEKFLDQSAPGPGVHDAGVPLKDQRRYLNFAAITKFLGDPASATDTIDEYISRNILYRGLVLRCAHCSDISWFSIDEITHTFTCRRCGRNQQYGKSSWKHGDEPSWFYKLDEIVYQDLVNNSTAPILTLAALKKSTRESFLFCPELRMRVSGDKKHFMELDICCISDGRLCVGEAKSNGALATKNLSASAVAEKYRELAGKLGATKVVFSTSSQTWDAAAELAINSTFDKVPHIQVLRLVAADLRRNSS